MPSITDTPRVLPTASTHPRLRAVLLFDALSCLAMGALPMIVAGAQRTPAVALVKLNVFGNVVWAAASVVVAFTADPMSVAGRGLVIAQGLAVAVLAALERRGLREA